MSSDWPNSAVPVDDDMVFIAKAALNKLIDENKKLKDRLGRMEHELSHAGRDVAVETLRKDKTNERR